jgi:hypothetical protein
LGCGLKTTEVAHISGLLFPQYQLCINLEKNWLGYNLGDFFTNSSGHPDQMSLSQERFSIGFIAIKVQDEVVSNNNFFPA